MGAAGDGPASWFVFGNSSVYDAQRGFDSRFGMNYDQAFPTSGIAVIRFASIQFAGAPTLQLNGPINIALIGDSGISDTGGGYTMNLSPAGSFTLATKNGNLALNSGTFSATGSTFKFLQLYQRGGGGGVTFNGNVDLPSASFYIDSAGSISLGGGSNVTANRAEFSSAGTMSLNGTLTTNFLQLWSGTSIQIKNNVASPNTLFAFAPFLSSTTSLNVLGGRLEIGLGGINAAGYNLTGFNDILTGGNIFANNLGATNQISAGGTIFGGSGTFNISAFSIAAGSGINYSGTGTGVGATLTLQAASLLFDSTADGINRVNLDGGDASLLGLAGGNGGTLNIGTTAAPIAGDVTINKAISATTGANGLLILTGGGNGGTVNVTANGTVAVNSTIKVSESAGSAKSARGGKINLTSNKTSGSAINVRSSAQLLALLNSAASGPGGSIKLISAGGDIDMSGTARADRGTVEITNNGSNGVVNVNNATLHGDVVKVGALGNDGTLNVGSGSINADSTIKLYAGGSNGTVNFSDNVTLSGNSIKTIAANTVNIFNGKVVTVNGLGPANVFTNNPNYTGFGGNGSTTGTFAGLGATTQPLSAGPPGY